MPALMRPGFTLAELLITWAILGIIATFTIPKILISQQNQSYTAMYKEAQGIVSAAYVAYATQYGYSTNTTFGAITPYLNYISATTSGNIDDVQGAGAWGCGGTRMCFALHNGSVLNIEITTAFGSTNGVLRIFFDPDGIYSGTTNGPGKSQDFYLYYNGRVDSAPHGNADWYVP
jgi:prepilin-type N-terminal cleavage/methylation domain-containing protein